MRRVAIMETELDPFKDFRETKWYKDWKEKTAFLNEAWEQNKDKVRKQHNSILGEDDE